MRSRVQLLQGKRPGQYNIGKIIEIHVRIISRYFMSITGNQKRLHFKIVVGLIVPDFINRKIPGINSLSRHTLYFACIKLV